MNSITQDMKYKQSLMKYSEKYGVSMASRKYNKGRSYIYFWRSRWDGTIESLACQSRRPKSHPKEHTKQEIKLIKNLRRRNPQLGLTELWYRASKQGYSRRPESMFRVMRRLGMFTPTKVKKPYKAKPYEQMQYAGQRIQIDVKVVPKACIADESLKLFQYTAIDEFSRLRFLYAYDEQSTFSSSDFLDRTVEFYRKHGFEIECVQTDNGFEFTKRFSVSKNPSPTMFEENLKHRRIKYKQIRPYTPLHNGKVERSHREDQSLFYSSHSFYSLDDLNAQLKTHLNRTNNRPMRPLSYRAPLQSLAL